MDDKSYVNTRKIAENLSDEHGVSRVEVEKAINLFYKGIAENIKENKVSVIEIKHFGKIISYDRNPKIHGTNNNGGRTASVQPASTDN